MPYIQGNYVTLYFSLVSKELKWDNTSFFYGYGGSIHPRNFIWVRVWDQFQAYAGNNVRGHRINATPTIYNNLASFVSTLSVSLEDGTPSPIISVSLFCQSAPYHIHSRGTKGNLGIINLGRDGSNAREIARIIFPFCLNILDFFNIWIIH
ncbi:hypothetical protein ACJW30_11G035200 [Castanea mollissima]